MSIFKLFLKDESGATALEYVMIGSLVSILVIFGAIAIGGKMDTNYSNVGSALN